MTSGVRRGPIILIGFMGSGKSSVGQLIAQRIGCPFRDTDRLVIRETGLEISELFAEKGEAFFRDRETAALRSLAGEQNCVIATGGGIVTVAENRTLLGELGFVVFLKADEETIFARVSRNQKRPLLQTDNPRQSLHDLLEKRLPLYEAAAHFTVDTSGRSHREIADEIMAASADFSWQVSP